MRPHGKARRPSIVGLCEGGATQPGRGPRRAFCARWGGGGMQRRPNATRLVRRDTRPSPIVEAFARLRRDDPERRLIYLPASAAAVSAAGVAESAAVVTSALNAARIGPGQVILSAVGNVPLWVGVFLACRARGNPLLPL